MVLRHQKVNMVTGELKENESKPIRNTRAAQCFFLVLRLLTVYICVYLRKIMSNFVGKIFEK